jgi:hypothetical protein
MPLVRPLDSVLAFPRHLRADAVTIHPSRLPSGDGLQIWTSGTPGAPGKPYWPRRIDVYSREKHAR